MTDTPMTLDVALARLRQYGERTTGWSTATYNDGTEKALHQIAVSLAAEVARLRARVAELEALEPAYRSQPLPPRDATCTCGHTGLDHHHSETKCWATLPRTQQRNGTWSAVPTCDCSEFEATP
ncbi:hypothetical protein [Streptomyces bacillaris]